MRAAHGVQVPSSALLRFLRHQLLGESPLQHSTLRSSFSSQRCRRQPSTAITPRRVTDRNRIGTHCRAFQTTSICSKPFWRHLRPPSQPKRRLQQDDLPYLHGFLDDGLGGRIIKPSNELRLRCTEFDENGNVTLVNGEFRKSELIAKVHLPHRLF
nr:mitochondrial inner membrane magnesium transporter mrs2 [Quercus suber]